VDSPRGDGDHERRPARPAALDRGGATDALRGDVVIKGGLTGMMKIGALAEAH
jgi:L-alanine-DL-glutamate epimerase-like enolase superfamily enzyme